MFELSPEARAACQRAIVLSGGARSGTTILGKILHSLENVEYAFEPPMLFSLFALLGRMPEADWRLLYETYLYEEHLMNALAGRTLNCNRADDSSIFRVKPRALVEARQAESLRKSAAIPLAASHHIAYKMPDVGPLLPELKRLYPETRIVLITREAVGVFHSLLEKGWFRTETLRTEDVIFPNRFVDGLRVPFWVAEEDIRAWVEANELHRVAYYYIRTSRAAREIPDAHRIRYADLVEDPARVVRELARALGLRFGPLTADLVATVRERAKPRDPSVLEDLRPAVRAAVLAAEGEVA